MPKSKSASGTSGGARPGRARKSKSDHDSFEVRTNHGLGPAPKLGREATGGARSGLNGGTVGANYNPSARGGGKTKNPARASITNAEATARNRQHRRDFPMAPNKGAPPSAGRAAAMAAQRARTSGAPAPAPAPAAKRPKSRTQAKQAAAAARKKAKKKGRQSANQGRLF